MSTHTALGVAELYVTTESCLCSDVLLVHSGCWLLYVLDGWCTATVTICCWLSPVPGRTLLLSDALYVCVRCPSAFIRTKCSGNVLGSHTRDLYRDSSSKAEIKSLLESVLGGWSHRSHSVLLWELMGKLGKVMGREELKIYNHPWMNTGIF